MMHAMRAHTRARCSLLARALPRSGAAHLSSAHGAGGDGPRIAARDRLLKAGLRGAVRAAPVKPVAAGEADDAVPLLVRGQAHGALDQDLVPQHLVQDVGLADLLRVFDAHLHQHGARRLWAEGADGDAPLRQLVDQLLNALGVVEVRGVWLARGRGAFGGTSKGVVKGSSGRAKVQLKDGVVLVRGKIRYVWRLWWRHAPAGTAFQPPVRRDNSVWNIGNNFMISRNLKRNRELDAICSAAKKMCGGFPISLESFS